MSVELLEPRKSVKDVPEFSDAVAHSTCPKTNCGSPEFILYPAPVLSYYPVDHFPGGSDSEESVCNAGDLGLIPRLGRSPQEGNGYPLQYSYLENSMERSLGGYSSCGHKESYMTEQLTFSLLSCLTCKITWQDYGKKF